MSQVPDAMLQDLTPADRNLLDRKLNKKIITATAVFVPAVLLAVAGLFYVNTSLADVFEENVRGFINLLLVVIGAFAGRLYVGQFLNFFKDKNSFQKKVYRGTVTAIEGRNVRINNNELKLDNEDAARLKKGAHAEVHLSLKSNIVLSVKVY
jgi:cytochrome c biogenesis protein CcdA